MSQLTDTTFRSQSQSQSLSQELSSARSPRHSLRRSHTSGSLSSLLIASAQANGSLSVPPVPSLPGLNVNHAERSVDSLEKEIMRLQEVLKEREAEISALEDSLKEKNGRPVTPVPPAPVVVVNGDVAPDALSPNTMHQFAVLRKGIVAEPEQDVGDAADSLDRLDELMRWAFCYVLSSQALI